MPNQRGFAPGPAPTADSLFLDYARAKSKIKEVDTELREIGQGLYALGEFVKSDSIGLPTVDGDTVLLKIPGQPVPKWRVDVGAVQRVADLITEHRRLLDRQRVLKRDLEKTTDGKTLLNSIR